MSITQPPEDVEHSSSEILIDTRPIQITMETIGPVEFKNGTLEDLMPDIRFVESFCLALSKADYTDININPQRLYPTNSSWSVLVRIGQTEDGLLSVPLFNAYKEEIPAEKICAKIDQILESTIGLNDSYALGSVLKSFQNYAEVSRYLLSCCNESTSLLKTQQLPVLGKNRKGLILNMSEANYLARKEEIIKLRWNLFVAQSAITNLNHHIKQLNIQAKNSEV